MLRSPNSSASSTVRAYAELFAFLGVLPEPGCTLVIEPFAGGAEEEFGFGELVFIYGFPVGSCEVVHEITGCLRTPKPPRPVPLLALGSLNIYGSMAIHSTACSPTLHGVCRASV